MPYKFSILLLIVTILACNKDIKQAIDFQYERRNINISPIYFYRGAVVGPDTFIRTDYDTYIRVQSINILFSNFYVTTSVDTLYTDSLLRSKNFFSLNFSGKTPAGFVPAGSYMSGGYGAFLGLDSAVNFGTSPDIFPKNHPLANRNIWEKDAGYDYFQLAGTVTDSSVTDTAKQTIPFLIRIRNLQNFTPVNHFQLKNFNIDNQKNLNFECYIGLDSVINLYNLYQNPIIGGTSFTLSSQDSMRNIFDKLYIDFQ